VAFFSSWSAIPSIVEGASWDLIVERRLSNGEVRVAIGLGARVDESSKRKLHALGLREI